MDYIQEMLLRQKRALAVLMLGETAVAGAKEDGETAVAGAKENEETALEAAAVKERQMEQETAQRSLAGAEQTARMGSGGARQERGTPVETKGRTMGKLLPYGSADAWDKGLAGETSAGQTANVKAMSRVIQRDARRYDGGFSIY